MAKYHINTQTGESGLCKAVAGRCPFGGAEAHYDSKEAAQAAYEESMGAETVAPGARKYDALQAISEARVYVLMETPTRNRNLKAGDEIVVKDKQVKIISTKIGYKYNAVTVEDPKKGPRVVNLPLDETQSAWIRTETEASKAARKVQEKEVTLQIAMDNYKPKREKVMEELQDRLDRGWGLSPYQIGELVDADAHDQVYRDYLGVVEHVKAQEPDHATPYTRANELLNERYTKEVLMAASGSNNVSTSEASNLFNRAMLSAKASYLSDGVGYLW